LTSRFACHDGKGFVSRAGDIEVSTLGELSVSGLSDRVVYRELFPKGLTLMDIKDIEESPKMTTSYVAARYELRKLLDQLDLPGWNG